MAPAGRRRPRATRLQVSNFATSIRFYCAYTIDDPGGRFVPASADSCDGSKLQCTTPALFWTEQSSTARRTGMSPSSLRLARGMVSRACSGCFHHWNTRLVWPCKPPPFTCFLDMRSHQGMGRGGGNYEEGGARHAAMPPRIRVWREGQAAQHPC